MDSGRTARERHAHRGRLGRGERVASAALAAGLAALGLTRRSRLAKAGVVAGAFLLAARAATGRSWLYEQLGLSSAGLDEGGGTDLTAAVTIAKPRDQVYGFWREVANLGRVMRHAEEILPLPGGGTHWKLRGPGGVPFEWDAELVDDHPGELLSWRSLEGSEVEQAGSVRFTDAPGGRGTEVHLRMRYRVPGGGPGQIGARLASPVTAALVREDLGRAKQMLEAGAVATAEPQPHGARG